MRVFKILFVFLTASLLFCSASFAEDNKFINYGNGMINASKYGIIKLRLPELSVEELKREFKAQGRMALQGAIVFSQPSEFTLTLFNQQFDSVDAAVDSINEAKKSYAKISKFLKSSDTYLEFNN